MNVFVVPSTSGGGAGQALAGLLVDGRLALDAGCVGLHGTPEEQARVRHVFLTHAHVDHVASLPILLDNVYRMGEGCPAVYGPPHAVESLRGDVFNNRLMPDFVSLSESNPPFLSLHPVEPGRGTVAGGYCLTAFPVPHPVPTFAYLVEDEAGTQFAYVTDTGDLEVLDPLLAAAPRLGAIFLEASFPKDLTALAELTGHLTTAQFLEAARRVPAGVRVLAVHIKPRYHRQVSEEIAAAGLAHAGVAEPGRTYCVG